MNLEEFRELRTPTGAAALVRAAELKPIEATLLSCVSRLREEFPAYLAAAAIETAMLRRKAAAKFSRANEMFFTREALEQSSSEIISRYRAERFAPFGRVADLCCGIGGDTIGLAKDHEVLAVDLDPLRLAMAEANVGGYGCRERVTFRQEDVRKVDLSEFDAAFVDPDRRTEGKRQLSIFKYQPALDELPQNRPLAVKIAPGVPHREIDDLLAEAEFISLDGELKECVLWFGALRSTARRATILPSRHTLAGEPRQHTDISAPKTYLFDPDPAVVRAGLVAQLGESLNASLIDPEIAFLTVEQLRPTPFATAYRIDEVHPFHLKRLAERLRALKVGRITVIKRGSAVDVDLLARKCKLDGPEHRAVILTRVAGKPSMLIGERVAM